MEFPTLQFAGFALTALIFAWSLKQYRNAQKIVLLLMSYFFAFKWQPHFLLILIASSILNWFLGEQLFDEPRKARRKLWLWLGILLNVGTLGFFKYYEFFVTNLDDIARLLGLEVHLPLLEILAPLGISFYTFQAISYLVDTYRNKSVRPKHLLDFLFFMAFFPKFAAGPICRSTDFMPQIIAPAPQKMPHVSRAAVLIFVGLFKKMILSVYLASHTTTDAFLSPNGFSSFELFVAVFAYSAQVYVDFSGYTDIARGIGYLFGYEFPENFNYPYGATDIGEYWRRWHMSFSRWLREYIYFPLGGSKVGIGRSFINLFITFLICGIWHGATWGFIAWGVLHGLLMGSYKLSLDLRRKFGFNVDGIHPWWWRALGWTGTISFCAFARIYFRANTLEDAHTYFAALFQNGKNGHALDYGLCTATIIVFFMNAFGKKPFNFMVDTHEKVPSYLRPILWTVLFVLLYTIKPLGTAATIYFQF